MASQEPPAIPPPAEDSDSQQLATAPSAPVGHTQLEPADESMLEFCDLCGEAGHSAAACPEEGAESPSADSPQTPPAEEVGGGWWSFAGTALRSFQETGTQLAHTIAEGATTGSKALSSVTFESLLPPAAGDDVAPEDAPQRPAGPQAPPASAAAESGPGIGKKLVSLTQQVESGLDVVEERLGAFSRKVFGADVDAKIGKLGTTLDKHLDKLEDQIGNIGGRVFSFIGSSVGMNPGSVSVADSELIELDEDASTYLLDPTDEYSASWSAYCVSARSTVSQRATAILKSNAIVRGCYTTLVPDQVSAELFWLRYTFKLELLHQRELRRQKLAQAVLDVDAEASATGDDDFQWSDGEEDVAAVESETRIAQQQQQHQQRQGARSGAEALDGLSVKGGVDASQPTVDDGLALAPLAVATADNDGDVVSSSPRSPLAADGATAVAHGDSSAPKVSVGRASVASSDRSSWAVVDDSTGAGKGKRGAGTPEAVAEGQEAEGEGRDEDVDWDAWE